MTQDDSTAQNTERQPAKIDAHFAGVRVRYNELQADPQRVEEVLRRSARRARLVGRG